MSELSQADWAKQLLIHLILNIVIQMTCFYGSIHRQWGRNQTFYARFHSSVNYYVTYFWLSGELHPPPPIPTFHPGNHEIRSEHSSESWPVISFHCISVCVFFSSFPHLIFLKSKCVASDVTEQIKASRTTRSRITFSRSTRWYEVGRRVFRRGRTHLRSPDLSQRGM